MHFLVEAKRLLALLLVLRHVLLDQFLLREGTGDQVIDHLLDMPRQLRIADSKHGLNPLYHVFERVSDSLRSHFP